MAAGTSTGGMTNKKGGRIGDSPIIGAGTYANNLTCAVSATGKGNSNSSGSSSSGSSSSCSSSSSRMVVAVSCSESIIYYGCNRSSCEW